MQIHLSNSDIIQAIEIYITHTVLGTEGYNVTTTLSDKGAIVFLNEEPTTEKESNSNITANQTPNKNEDIFSSTVNGTALAVENSASQTTSEATSDEAPVQTTETPSSANASPLSTEPAQQPPVAESVPEQGTKPVKSLFSHLSDVHRQG